MKKRIIAAAIITGIVLAVIGCSSVGKNKPAKENESEIIISVGSTIYKGQYNVFLNGDSRKTIKNKGGTVKYIVPNGQHVIMVQWQELYGVSAEMASIQVRSDSNKTVLYVHKPIDGEKMEIFMGGTADMPQPPVE